MYFHNPAGIPCVESCSQISQTRHHTTTKNIYSSRRVAAETGNVETVNAYLQFCSQTWGFSLSAFERPYILCCQALLLRFSSQVQLSNLLQSFLIVFRLGLSLKNK
ncbi:Hypothetical_protein [Hexamita inflata]|uniref:Hypothetical_protein n=1 Tax=Hexamita inflata TaxID=28002 RepID=A0AA86Q272_9EUKA|nr:Hypothetical protein HINF_LOCUS38405 [Hexamita inflata]CAI9950762.1 Hypothetical protein HINF_LOCUS38407 [Hexamita inflata]